MKRNTILLASVSVLLFACNNNPKSTVEKADSANEAKQDNMPATMPDEASSSFLVDAANGGMAEVEFSKIAQEKSTNAKVKEFATMMVNDHTGVNAQVKELAAKKNISLPAAITDDKKKKATDLSGKTGKEFDKAYMETMVSDHKSTVDLFQKASSNAKDSDIKNWVDITLPKIQSHLDMAKSIENGLK